MVGHANTDADALMEMPVFDTQGNVMFRPGRVAEPRGGPGRRGLVDLRARLGRERLGDLDVRAELVLDPHRADPRLGEQIRVA